MAARGFVHRRDEDAPTQQAVDDRPQRVIASHDVTQPATTHRRWPRRRALAQRIVDHDECRSARVALLQQDQRVDGGGRPAHHHGIGDIAERRGDGSLRPVLDVDEASERAQDTGKLVCRIDERRCGVLSRQPERQGVQPGGEGDTLALAVRLGRSQALHVGVRSDELSLGLLVLGVETDFTLVQTSNLHFDGLELLLRLFTAGGHLGDRRRQSLDLMASSLQTRTGRIDLAGEPNQALAAVGSGTLEGGDALLLGALGFLSGMPCLLRGGEGIARGLDLAAKLELLLAQCTRFSVDLLRVTPGRFLLSLGLQVAHPLA